MQVLTNTMANFKKSAYIVKQKLCREKVNITFKVFNQGVCSISATYFYVIHNLPNKDYIKINDKNNDDNNNNSNNNNSNNITTTTNDDDDYKDNKDNKLANFDFVQQLYRKRICI